MQKLVNYTPHPVTIDGETYPSAGLARVEVREDFVLPGQRFPGSPRTNDLPCPVVMEKFGEVVGLPETPDEDTVYLVSRLVAEAVVAPARRAAEQIGAESPVKPRWRVAVPASFYRDNSGRIIGARGVALYW